MSIERINYAYIATYESSTSNDSVFEDRMKYQLWKKHNKKSLSEWQNN